MGSGIKEGWRGGRRPPRHVRHRHAQRGCAGEGAGAGGHPHRGRHLPARRGARYRGQPHRQQPRRTLPPSLRRPLPDARGRTRMAPGRGPRRRRRARPKAWTARRCSSTDEGGRRRRMKTLPIARRFARFACGLERVEPEVGRAADRAMLDTLGVMLAGGAHPSVRALAQAAARGEGRAALATGGRADAEAGGARQRNGGARLGLRRYLLHGNHARLGGGAARRLRARAGTRRRRRRASLRLRRGF